MCHKNLFYSKSFNFHFETKKKYLKAHLKNRFLFRLFGDEKNRKFRPLKKIVYCFLDFLFPSSFTWQAKNRGTQFLSLNLIYCSQLPRFFEYLQGKMNRYFGPSILAFNEFNFKKIQTKSSKVLNWGRIFAKAISIYRKSYRI